MKLFCLLFSASMLCFGVGTYLLFSSYIIVWVNEGWGYGSSNPFCLHFFVFGTWLLFFAIFFECKPNLLKFLEENDEV